MAERPAANRRIIALALCGSAAALGLAALGVFVGLVPTGEELRGTLAGVLGAVALVDLVLAVWFFRTSLDS